jgi:hypothetical protein
MYVSIMSIAALILTLVGMPSFSSLAFASIVDYEDESEKEEECKEESVYDYLCNGGDGVNGLPFCDEYNATERVRLLPNLTVEGCYDRTTDPVSFCEEFDDLTSTYEDCRLIPGSEEYTEYLETGGPDESCLFDVYQIKCLPHPLADDCPENFWTNEDGYCFPVNENDNWVCPEGYHDVDDDESGQCYPNSEECPSYAFLVPDEDEEDDGDRCASIDSICSYENHTADICLTNPPVTDYTDDELNCFDVLDQQSINFKVPEDNKERQNVDTDNDGIGCEAKEDIGFSSNENALLHQKFDKFGDKVIQNVTNIDIASLKANIMSKNHTGDFNVDTLAFGIDNDGRGILCLVDETKEKAECQDFLVPGNSISDDVMSLMRFPK